MQNRTARIGDHRQADRVGNIPRLPVNGPAKLLDAPARGIDIGSEDIARPERRHALEMRRLLHDPAHAEIANQGHLVPGRLRRVSPADDFFVEGLGGLHVRCGHVVPDEWVLHLTFFSLG